MNLADRKPFFCKSRKRFRWLGTGYRATYLIVQGPSLFRCLRIEVPHGSLMQDGLSRYIVLQGLGDQAQDEAIGGLASLKQDNQQLY